MTIPMPLAMSLWPDRKDECELWFENIRSHHRWDLLERRWPQEAFLGVRQIRTWGEVSSSYVIATMRGGCSCHVCFRRNEWLRGDALAFDAIPLSVGFARDHAHLPCLVRCGLDPHRPAFPRRCMQIGRETQRISASESGFAVLRNSTASPVNC